MTMLNVSVAFSSGLKQPDSSHQAYLSNVQGFGIHVQGLLQEHKAWEQMTGWLHAILHRTALTVAYVAASTILGS